MWQVKWPTQNKGRTVKKIINKKELIEELKELGLRQGMIIEVHSSLSSFGYVVGGAQTIVDALIEVVGYNGTILMPLHCQGNSEPSIWSNPPCPPEMVAKVRQGLPIFHRKETDAYNMGQVVDNLRRRDGVLISEHPNRAYIAWGKYSKLLCNHQSLNFAWSQESPAARLYELKGHVLLLGVDYDKITSLHLAEYYGNLTPIAFNCAMNEDKGFRKFQRYLDLDNDSSQFHEIGALLEKKGYVQQRVIGKATCKLMPFDVALDYGVKYLKHKSVLSLYR